MQRRCIRQGRFKNDPGKIHDFSGIRLLQIFGVQGRGRGTRTLGASFLGGAAASNVMSPWGKGFTLSLGPFGRAVLLSGLGLRLHSPVGTEESENRSALP